MLLKLKSNEEYPCDTLKKGASILCLIGLDWYMGEVKGDKVEVYNNDMYITLSKYSFYEDVKGWYALPVVKQGEKLK